MSTGTDVRGENIAEQSSHGGPDAALPAPFSHVDTWVFDLDNTLYPSECNLFAQVDRRMGEFIAGYLGVPYEHARHLQKTYYRQFGTTLNGLMTVHKMDPKAFLDYVHDIDLSVVAEAPGLRSAIEKLPGRKLIFTNGTVAHAERVAAKIGVLDLMDGIADIVTTGYRPKPGADAFDAFVERHEVSATTAAMFEDMPHNLEVPHALGMRTVLIQASMIDHPAQEAARKWQSPPEHIHHMTPCLERFLTGMVGSQL